MILVAATAIGLAVSRIWFQEYLLARPNNEDRWLRWLLVAVSLRLLNYVPVLAACTVALFVLQLRQPRPRLRSLARRPGWVAVCAAVTGLAIAYVLVALKHAKGLGGWLLVEVSILPVGVAVAAAWVNLAVSGLWRPENQWIDRLGRVAGVCWIAVTFLQAGLLLLN
jgi:hypothetical protein